MFETWMRRARTGARPAMVTSTADPGALSARGITSLVHAEPTGRTFYTSVSDADVLNRTQRTHTHAEH